MLLVFVRTVGNAGVNLDTKGGDTGNVSPGLGKKLRTAQLVMGVDSHAGVDAFTATHGSRVGLFELQVNQGFGLSLRGVPTTDFQSADVITRPRRTEIIRLKTVM